MRRLVFTGFMLISTLIALAACGGTPQTDEALPTLAQLPTLPPSPLPATAVATLPPTEIPPTPVSQPTILATRPPAGQSASSATPELPPLLQGVTATLPFDISMDVFPTLKTGNDVTLRGLLTVDTDGAVITDTEETSITVLIDPFVGSVANGQIVEISGKVIEQEGKLVVQMTAITVLAEATPEAGGIPPLPTAGVPPLPTEGVPPLPTSGS